MKLLLTRELGRLARWLRIMGFDSEYTRQNNNASVLMQALREDRTILTRNHHLPASRGIKILVLEQETIKEQLGETLRLLRIDPGQERMFTRCTICNKELTAVAKESVKDKVPEYVFSTQEDFYSCGTCGRIYWHGTHWGNVRQLLDSIKE
ncbi:MAG: Mut7-C RNAse domain-containing protein [Candidatus Omnitrophica bacterium]|nr:Mut7-C RNAse domain-containing protein [Candidatus Omnitrophota bacterium]